MNAKDHAKLPRNIEIVRGPAILGMKPYRSFSRGSRRPRALVQQGTGRVSGDRDRVGRRLGRVSVRAPDTVKGSALGARRSVAPRGRLVAQCRRAALTRAGGSVR